MHMHMSRSAGARRAASMPFFVGRQCILLPSMLLCTQGAHAYAYSEAGSHFGHPALGFQSRALA